MSLAPERLSADAGTAIPDPAHRLRRTRRTETMRAFVRETRLHPRQLVAPMFVQPGREGREPVGSMPGVLRVTPDEALKDARSLAALGIGRRHPVRAPGGQGRLRAPAAGSPTGSSRRHCAASAMRTWTSC